MEGQPVPVFPKIRVWPFEDRLIVEPLEGKNLDDILQLQEDAALDRVEPSFIDRVPYGPPAAKPFTSFGFLGLIRLLTGWYAVFVTKRKLLGMFRGHPVYEIASAVAVRVTGKKKTTSPSLLADETQLLHRLHVALSSPGLLFSYAVDITYSTQETYALTASRFSLPLWFQAFPKYLWNRHLLSPLVKLQKPEFFNSFVLPVMQGSFHSLSAELSGSPLEVTVIARRAVDRLGTRMWCRGADQHGGIANFVETEQILTIGDYTAAYVQVRGSIPLTWRQEVDLTYKPKIKLTPIPFNQISTKTSPLSLHFEELRKDYQEVAVVDLVKQDGSERVLGSEYKRCLEQTKVLDVSDARRYVSFDFHRVCGNMHFHRVDGLFSQILATAEEFGYFLSRGSEVLKEQSGVFRTNCIDCLDRTNVTQSVFARKALESQLREVGKLARFQYIADFNDLSRQLKELWADHGDDVSVQYSGTGALKGDYVRYGKRSVYGLLRDGYFSLMRYYYNNFSDGFKQDALDLVSGKYSSSPSKPSPFKASLLDKALNVSLFVPQLFLSVPSTLVALRNGNAFQVVIFVTWTMAILATLKLYGKKFCTRPVLSPA